jgi:hypothetical protein
MTVLSVLLGVDVILGNRAALVRLLAESLKVAGRALLAYLERREGEATDGETETGTETRAGSDSESARASESESEPEPEPDPGREANADGETRQE